MAPKSHDNNSLINKKSRQLKQRPNKVTIRTIKLKRNKTEYRLKKINENVVPRLKANKINTNKVFVREKQKEETNSRTIFVGNLPKSITRKQLKKLFVNYGPVESVWIRCPALNFSFLPRSIATDKKDLHPKATCLNGYVKFKDEDTVEKSLKANGLLYDENYIRVDRVDSNVPENAKHSIFLGNLPFDVADNSVREIFHVCGDIESVRVVRDSATGIGKGFGYVNFKNPDSIELALKLNGTLLNKRSIRVKRSVKKLALKRNLKAADANNKTSSTKSDGNSALSSPVTRTKRSKEEKKKQKVLGFQGRTVTDKVIKKKKSKKKLRKEFHKKQLIELLAKTETNKKKHVAK